MTVMQQNISIPQTIDPGQENRDAMSRRKRFRRVVVSLLLTVIALPTVSMGWLAIRLGQAFQRYPRPQAIFVLGGHAARYSYALKMAATRPGMEIIVSSGISDGVRRRLATEAGVDPERVTLDLNAVDTLTNFTVMVDLLEARGYGHVYLVTSDHHMRRACAVAWIVLAARGIAFTPVPVAGGVAPETRGHAFRDAVRAFFWLVSGWDKQYIPFSSKLT